MAITAEEMLSAHQKKNSDDGQSFEKRVAKIVEASKSTNSVIHGNGITVEKIGKKDEFVRPDIRAKFNNRFLDNVEVLIDCTTSMRNDRIRAKKFDGLVVNSWKQKLYLHIVIFPKAEEFTSKYANYENEIYYCEREVMMQANDIGICGQSIALMEDDLDDFLEEFNKLDIRMNDIDDVLKEAKKAILKIRTKYNQDEFIKRYPKYRPAK